ncbi:GGDEF domain-containing protein [Geomonas nitrogeniifigens]|uniref:diguanylate cyclase n=1 Tax=Geomonas diazotrophica TaxID=2843197 RepID=A0ABX8JEP7_9BACT|nr:GGDEF domain-containing protein [Geomonas nitrogeniifigens]QWV96878.1 GGDEF domain-containing protein [Geomonas nitrogeniifigens]
MIEAKGWVTAKVGERYTGHNRVLGVIASLLVGLVLLDVYLVPLQSPWGMYVVLASLVLGGFLLPTRLLLPDGQLKASLELVLLLIYLVAVCWFTGRTDSPFVSAIYLVLMATSLTLGRRITYLMAGLAVASYSLLATGESPPLWSQIPGYLIHVFPFILIAHVGAILAGETEAARAEVERLSLTDDLTELNNMRSFEALALQQEKVARRYQAPFAICMLDADNLKQINDRYGHLAGTELIKWTARVIRSNIRESDIAARFGGDEFIIMYTDHDKEQIRPAVERIVRAMSSCPFSYDGDLIECTLSAGIASFPWDGDDLKSVVKQADLAMYRSKRLGKNRVSLAESERDQGAEREKLQVRGEKLRGRVPQLDGERTGVHLGKRELPR